VSREGLARLVAKLECRYRELGYVFARAAVVGDPVAEPGRYRIVVQEGVVNRVEALEQAITRLKHHHPQAKEVAMASDAFFPFADSMEIAASAGIRWVIQPGGSIRDPEVFAKAKELNMNTVLTYTRHFRH